MQHSATRSQIQFVCMLVLATSALTYMIYWLRPVLVPFVVAVFFVTCINPVLSRLQDRLGVTRLIAAGITFVAGLTILLILAVALWASIAELSKNAGAYEKRMADLITLAEKRVPLLFSDSQRSPLAPDGKKEANEKNATEDETPASPGPETPTIAPSQPDTETDTAADASTASSATDHADAGEPPPQDTAPAPPLPPTEAELEAAFERKVRAAQSDSEDKN